MKGDTGLKETGKETQKPQPGVILLSFHYLPELVRLDERASGSQPEGRV